jgi:hypothetical protein
MDDDDVLLFWEAGPNQSRSPAEICRELIWGEEVEGLIDLPIKEVIERLKKAFPRHEELPGQLICRTAGGSFEASWGWQYVKAVCRDMNADDVAKLVHAVGYAAYDAEGNVFQDG